MLTIKIEDVVLGIDPTTKLRFEINSTLFDSEAIPGSYICPFDIPVKGNDVFNNAEFIEINRTFKKYECSIYLNDFLLFTGELLLNSSKPKVYRCSVILTGISSDFPEQKLNELNFGEHITYSSLPAYADEVNSMPVQDSICAFPVIHNTNMYGSSDDLTLSPANKEYGQITSGGGPLEGKYINHYNWDSNCYPFNNIQNWDDTFADNAFVMIPQFKLVYIVKKIFESIGYSVTGDFFTDEFIARLLFINYFAADEKWKHFYVAAGSDPMLSDQSINGAFVQTIQFENDSTLGYQDLDNCWDNTTNYYLIQSPGAFDLTLKMHMVMTVDLNESFYINVVKLLAGVETIIATQTYTGLPFEYDLVYKINHFFDFNDVGAEIRIEINPLGNTFILTAKYLQIIATSYQNLNRYSSAINIANHVTSNTVASVLNALKLNFALAIWFDQENKVCEISFIKDLLNSVKYFNVTPYVIKDSLEISLLESVGYKLTQKTDINSNDVALMENLGKFMKFSDLPTPDKLNVIAEVKQEGLLYIFKQDDTTGLVSWVKYGSTVNEIVFGKAKTETVMPIGITTNIVINSRLIPESKQLGTSPCFETGVNDSDMQLLIWYGMTLDLNGNPYPFASALKYSVVGGWLSQLDLKLEGENGLYESFLKSWYEFNDNAETVSLQLKLNHINVIEILKLFKPQFEKASQQTRKIKYNGSLILPKSLSILIPVTDGLIEAEIVALKEGGIEL